MVESATWTWEDGWILASIVIAHRSEHPDLAGVIRIADYINRLIVSRDEIETAANRLCSAGLLDISDPLVPLDRAEELWNRAGGAGGSIASIKRCIVLMNTEAGLDLGPTHWTLSEPDYRAALDLYLRRFDEALHRIEDGGADK